MFLVIIFIYSYCCSLEQRAWRKVDDKLSNFCNPSTLDFVLTETLASLKIVHANIIKKWNYVTYQTVTRVSFIPDSLNITLCVCLKKCSCYNVK